MFLVVVTSGAIVGATGSGAAAALGASPPPPVDEPHTYDPPSRPGGQWTQVYARTDPVGQHVLGYYRVVVPAPSPAPAPSPSVPPPTAWPTGFPGVPD